MGGGRARAGAVRGGLERFALGWSRFGSFSAAAATLSPPDPIWVFLDRRLFLGKPPILGVGKAWISLDSLVRIETYQWVTRISPESFFLPAFVVAKELSNRLAHDLAWRRDGLLMKQA
jgi:hypothetical protein